MAITVLDQLSYNDFTRTPDGLLVDTAASKAYTLPPGTTTVLLLTGGWSQPEDHASPDNPRPLWTKRWTPSSGSPFLCFSLTVSTSPLDGDPGTEILYEHDGVVPGPGILDTVWDADPPYYGVVGFIPISGLDLVTPRTELAVHAKTSRVDQGTTTSESYVVPSSNYGLFTVIAGRGAEAITPDINQTVLVNMLSEDGNCRTVITYRSGASPLACSFSWASLRRYAISTLVLAPGLGGNQVMVIG